MTFADRGSVARRALPYAAGLAALLVAAGCTSSSPTPANSSPAPTTATSSPTPTPSGTTTTPKPTTSVDPVMAKIPAAARAETDAGAAAFAEFYFEQVNKRSGRGIPVVRSRSGRASLHMCEAFAEGHR